MRMYVSNNYHTMRIIVIILCLIFSTVLNAQPAKLYPPENEIADTSLTLFIDSLKAAIDHQDKDFIIHHLSKHVKNSFGGDGGIAEFKTYWHWDSTHSKLWPLLDKIVSMGGGYTNNKDSYSFPYVFTDWPEDYDPFAHAAITGSNVNVRDQPSLEDSKVLGQITYDIVRLNYEKSYPPFTAPQLENVDYVGPKEWYYVESIDNNVKGFVYWDYVWSPIDYRLGLMKEENRWTIMYLVAGD